MMKLEKMNNITLKLSPPFLLILLSILFGCKNKPQEQQKLEPNYYKNLYTQEVYTPQQMKEFVDSLFVNFNDTSAAPSHIHFWNYEIIETNDSVIQSFKYDFRVGIDYKIRAKKYDKIGMYISPKKFQTINGDSITIGGKLDKPTVINLWFYRCGGCVAEIPALNRIYDKYSGSVNFIALSDDNAKDVRKFLKKTPFKFTQITSENWKRDETSLRPYFEEIGSYPFPENIFIDRNGSIRFIEGMIPKNEDKAKETKHFEMIIDSLLMNK